MSDEHALVVKADVLETLSLERAPQVVLEEAQQAAAALKGVIDRKPRPVKFKGETYLEFEDWQTVGRFYGVTAKVVSTTPVTVGDATGYESHAVAINVHTGMEISAADSMCLNNEDNWKHKPMFQIRSMAQTRACSKALRNVLAWVVVLAGYRPTPAEEMDGRDEPPVVVSVEKSEKGALPSDVYAAGRQRGWAKDQTDAFVAERFGGLIVSSLTRGAQCAQAITMIQTAE